MAGEEGVLAAPTPVTATADMDYSVLSASCSLRQSFFVTASHLLVSAGENEHGELGRTGKRNHFLQLDMLSKYQVREVAAGNGFSHACTADGRVISWGRNELGQLGHLTSLHTAYVEKFCAHASVYALFLPPRLSCTVF